MAGLQFSSGIDKGFETDLKRLNKRMNEFEGKTLKSSDKIDKSFGNIANTIKNLVAFGGFAAIGVELKQLTDDTYKYRNELTKLTGLQGENLNDLTANMQASSDTFGQDLSTMSVAINNFAKGMEVDLEEAMKTVDEGFIDGTNAGGAFLEIIKEYSPLMKEAGLSTKQFTGAIKLQNQLGVKDDYGIDAIKEAMIRIREMTPATKTALESVKINVADMQKSIADGTLTYFGAAQQVSEKLAEIGNTGKQTGTIIADVFGGAGENAGFQYLATLKDVNGELDKSSKKLSATQSQEQELLKVNKELQKSFSDLLPDKNPLTEIAISAKEALVFLIENKSVVFGLVAAYAAWKTSIAAKNQLAKIGQIDITREITLQKEAAVVEAARLKQTLQAVSAQSLASKQKIASLSAEIQVQKTALSAAITSKNLQKARTAQQKIANLESQRTIAIESRKTLQVKANTAATQLATVQTRVNTLATKAAAISSSLFTKANAVLGRSFKKLGGLIASNPWGLLVTGISLALPWIMDFMDSTNEAAESQGGFNDELERTSRIAKSFKSIQEKQGLNVALTGSELTSRKSEIEQQIKDEKEGYKQRLIDLKKSLKADAELQELTAKSINENTTELQRGFYARQAKRRTAELAQETLDFKHAYDGRIVELREYLGQTEKLISEQPEKVAKKTEEQKERDRKAAQKRQDDAQKALFKNIEIENQFRKNEIIKQYGWAGAKQTEFHQLLLENELKYLLQKRKITTDELLRLRLDQKIIETRALTSPKIVIPEKAHKDVDLALKGLEKYAKLIKEAEEATKEANTEFKDSIEIYNGVNEIMNTLVSSFDGLDSTVSSVLEGVAGSAQGLLGMANGFKSVTAAVTGLEKASAILAIVSAAIQLSQAISGAFEKIRQERIENYVRESAQVHDINIALLEQNRLYEEGNELLSSDKWGTALHGLDTYNQALEFQKDLISELAVSDVSSNPTLGGDVLESIVSPFKGSLSVLGGAREREQLDSIKEQAASYSTELEQALAGVAVKTDKKGKVGKFFGAADEYESLLGLYPQVIDEAGNLNSRILQTILDSEDLGEVDKQRLNQLIELTAQAEQAYAEFGSYISGIFGGVGDDISQAFQDMYTNGSDAMLLLEGSMSDMIESFTRDMVEFSLLQPLTSQANETAKALGEEYSKGDISAEQLQEGIVTNLGEFYDSLNTIQPEILKAYENADKLAAESGFDSAFSGGESTASGATSRTGEIQKAITEQTSSELVGRISALMLSNEVISQNSFEMLDLAVANLVTLNKIKENTDFLPQIATNTKKTYEKLSNL